MPTTTLVMTESRTNAGPGYAVARAHAKRAKAVNSETYRRLAQEDKKLERGMTCSLNTASYTRRSYSET